MQRALGGLAIVAAGLLVTASLMGAGPFSDDRWPSGGLNGGRITIDAVSFGLGLVAGLLAVWLAKVPWGTIPRHIMGMVLGWRRNAFLMTVAMLAAGILLFY